MKILNYIKSIIKLCESNFCGYKCPVCDGISSNYMIYNEIYKKYNYYTKCKFCNLVTPAFDTINEALDYWDLYYSRYGFD